MLSNIPVCKIHVAVNPKLDSRYVININMDTGDLIVQIRIRDINSLNTVARSMRDTLCIKRKYKLIFNFKSAPMSAYNNIEFKNIIQKIFQVSTRTILTGSHDIVNMTDILQNHIATYGHNPNMTNRSPSKIINIHNYMESVLNVKLPRSIVIQIADLLSES